jgi:hypothetical protein
MLKQKRFQRRTENFICEKCGFSVRGTGYTDHCPECLWSKHVDINPGDRNCNCGGLMEPISAEKKSGEYIIYYKCQECSKTHRIKATTDDDIEKIIEISATLRK